MIKIFLLDRRLLSEDINISFGASEAARLEAIKNPQRHLESLSALVALDRLLKLSFGDAKFEILRGERGKPYFKDSDISFSLSHSGDLSVASICDEKYNNVGIDVEKITDLPNMNGIAERFFTDQEKSEFLRRERAADAFFEIWTKKEAYAKMTGQGLSSALGDDISDTNTKFDIKCYEFYNNNDRYSLSLSSYSDIIGVEFYNNSDVIKITKK